MNSRVQKLLSILMGECLELGEGPGLCCFEALPGRSRGSCQGP